MPTLSWTPAELATLLQMKMDGCSASVIGDKIGRTRNAVIGRMHRLGLSKPAAQKADRWHADKTATLKTMLSEGHGFGVIANKLAMSQSAIRSKVRRDKLPTIALSFKIVPRIRSLVVRKPTQGEPPSLQLTIFDLKATTCRWPQGEPGALRYCGHDAPIERAYCDYHHDLAHCKGTVSERRASEFTNKRIAA